MSTRKSRGAPGALAMLTLMCLLVAAPAARAADPDAPTNTADGWKKVLSYGRCALLVFRSRFRLRVYVSANSCIGSLLRGLDHEPTR